MAKVVAYHGAAVWFHEAQFALLSEQGYRPLSLCIYGDPDEPLYAAVWIKRPGPKWVAIGRTSADGYQDFFNKWYPEGYRPTIVSATGAGSDARFTGVMEQDKTKFVAEHGMSLGDLWDTDESLGNGYVLRSCTVYGDEDEQWGAAVWDHEEPNKIEAAGLSSTWFDSDEFQLHYDGAMQGGIFPEVIVLAPWGDWSFLDTPLKWPAYNMAGWRADYDQEHHKFYEGVRPHWRADDNLSEWKTRSGLSASEYQQEFENQKALGFYPTRVWAAGPADEVVFAAVFIKH